MTLWRVDFENGYALFSDYESALTVFDDPAWDSVSIREMPEGASFDWKVDGMPDFVDLVRMYEDVYERN